MRALTSHQCDPGSNPGFDFIHGLSLLMVLSLAPRGFSPGTPVFPSPQKRTFLNSISTRNQVDEEPLCACATSKSLFIYLFIYLLFTAKIEPWFSQVTTKPLYENERATAFWDVLLFADTTRVKANRIDATIIDKTRNQVREIELSCPWLENREIESLKISRRQRSTVNWD